MVLYELGAFQNSTGNFSDFFAFSNSNAVTSYVWGMLVLLGFFIIIFTSLKQFGTPQAIGAASVLTAAFGLFARMAHIINDLTMYIAIIVLGVSAIMIYASNKPS